MKQMIFALLALMSTPAFAEKFTCNFTEPFITIKLDTVSYDLNWESPDLGSVRGILYEYSGSDKAIFVRFEVGNQTHRLNLDLETPGSDGMSEFVYPVRAKLNEQLWGGCYSAERPVTCPSGNCG
ncbi:MAG: hypothetical protein AB7O96_17415 [Pseudobdellovibrionaceae bacterium]